MMASDSKDGDSSLHMIQTHFFSISSQGNIYTISELSDENSFEKILVATLHRKIYCIDYLNTTLHTREIFFTHIPSEAEIISLNALNKSNCKDEFIIGISLIKKTENHEAIGQFLNFYSWDVTGETDPACISNIPLTFMPYYLHHHGGIRDGKYQTVWLLTGSDSECHVYDWSITSDKYEEGDCDLYFPELMNASAIIIKIDILYSENRKRRTTVTCDECGKVSLYKVDLSSGNPVMSSSQQMIWDTLASSATLFSSTNYTSYCKPGPDLGSADGDDDVNIVVANCFEQSYFYKIDLDKKYGQKLPDSNSCDVVTCCLVCDINHDGSPEILLGTYGQAVKIYKYDHNKETWLLFNTLQVPFPVLALKYLDVVGDGSKQLIVMTTDGIHIFQNDPIHLVPLIISRMKQYLQQDLNIKNI